DPHGGTVDAVLEQVWRLPRGESDFVTVVVPEQFRRRALREAARHPFEFALKLRLLTEPGVVVADVPTVDENPGGRPLAVRIFVLPELILRGWRRLLHNQRALYVKRLLLVEPHVILASVPYQLIR